MNSYACPIFLAKISTFVPDFNTEIRVWYEYGIHLLGQVWSVGAPIGPEVQVGT